MSDGGPSPIEQILFLARAESRVEIVRHLLKSEPATQRDLRARLDASRTTVSRALSSLVERDWVEESGGTYRLTSPGRAITGAFTDLLATVEAVDELAPFLRWFPADVDAPDFLGADDVAVTYATEADPYAPAREQTGILHTADRLRILLPAIDRDSTETLVEQVTERGLEVETVVSPAVEATMESEAFAPLIRETLRTGRSTVLVAPEPVPFYLGLADDGRVQVGLADEEGFPRALLETTDEAVREWATALYREYRTEAEPKPLEAF